MSQEGKGRDFRVETSAHPTGHRPIGQVQSVAHVKGNGKAAARLGRMVWSVSASEWSSEGTMVSGDPPPEEQPHTSVGSLRYR